MSQVKDIPLTFNSKRHKDILINIFTHLPDRSPKFLDTMIDWTFDTSAIYNQRRWDMNLDSLAIS